MDLTLLQITGALLAIGTGAFIQAALGFGMGIVSAPILYLIEPSLVPFPIIVASLTLTLLALVHDRDGLKLEEVKGAVFGRLLGVGVGVWALSVATPRDLALSMGATVLLAVVLSLSSFQIRPSKRTFFIAGMISGVMGTTTGIGGPPMAIAYQNQTGSHLRGNLAAFFVVGCVLSLMGIILTGQVPPGGWKMGALFVPTVIISFFVSKRLVPGDIKWARPAILALSSLAGVTSLLKAWL